MTIYLRTEENINICECEILKDDISVYIYLKNFVLWYQKEGSKIEVLESFNFINELREYYQEVLYYSCNRDFNLMNEKIKKHFKYISEELELAYIED